MGSEGNLTVKYELKVQLLRYVTVVISITGLIHFWSESKVTCNLFLIREVRMFRNSASESNRCGSSYARGSHE